MKYININFTSYLFLTWLLENVNIMYVAYTLCMWLTFCFCWGVLLLRAVIELNGDAPFLFTLAQARTALTCGMAGMSKSQCTEGQGHATRAGTQRVLLMKRDF